MSAPVRIDSLVGKRVRVFTLSAGSTPVDISFDGTLSELKGHLLYLTDVILNHGGRMEVSDRVFNTMAENFVSFGPIE